MIKVLTTQSEDLRPMAAPTPTMTRSTILRTLDERLAHLEDRIAGLLRSIPATAGDFLALEREAIGLGAGLADDIIQAMLEMSHADANGRRNANEEARERLREAGVTRRIDNLGPRPVRIRLPGGRVVPMKTPYLRPSRKGQVGRPKTKRGAAGSGCYPLLERLGILDGVTPLMRSKIARQIVLCGSYAEALDQLRLDGIELDVSTMVRVAVATGASAMEHRDQALARALIEPLPEYSMVDGERIRVSLDGGRARTRKTNKKHKKGKNGRRTFTLPWREPRVITVDVLDEDGRIDSNVPPIYEVDLGDADRVFDLVVGLLRFIGAHRAREIVFVADGADWIWARVDAMIERAGLPVDRTHKILDFYHASEHIADALRACKNLSDTDRRTQHKTLSRKMVRPGGPQEVIDRLVELARGRRGKRVNKEIKYLRKHLDHMRYAEWRLAKVPIGSGVVESAIRRIINLRFKAASMCWREDHLAALLYLRCALKSGRWEAFMLGNVQGRYWLAADTTAEPPAEMEAA